MIWYAQRLAAICFITNFLAFSATAIASPEDPVEDVVPEESQVGQAWPSGWATSVAPLGDSGKFVAATADGLLMREAAVVEFDAADLTQATAIYTHPASVWAVAASDAFICSTDYRGNLGLFDRGNSKATIHEGVFERWTRALAIAPDGKNLLAGNEGGKLLVWSFEKGEIVQSVEVDAQQLYSLAFSPSGDRIAVSDGGGHVHVLSWPELQPVKKLELGEQPVWAAQFSSDGQSIIAGGADRKLWSAPLTEGSAPAAEGSAPTAEGSAPVIVETSDWISTIEYDSKRGVLVAGTLAGEIFIVSDDGKSATKIGALPSPVWSVIMPSADSILAATRKHAVAALGQTWNVRFAEEPGLGAAAAGE